MSRIPLYAMAHPRYEILRAWLTPERVKAHFAGIVLGEVERFELPNLLGLNFLLGDSLGGSGSASLKTDAQGKTHAMALLRIEVEVPQDYRPTRTGALAPEGEIG